MSTVNGKHADFWIKENHPENGLFRVYYKDIIGDSGDSFNGDAGATFDKNKGEGLRWEWYYKDGRRADGISRGWYPSGKLKIIITWKNGKQHGKQTEWYENDQIYRDLNYKNGSFDGKYIKWHENGQKMSEVTYKDHVPDGEYKCWNQNGEVLYETEFVNGNGVWKMYFFDGRKKEEWIWKNGIKMIDNIKYNTTRGNITDFSHSKSDLKNLVDNIKDTDDATGLINAYDQSEPKDGWFRRYWSNGQLRYEWEYKDGKRVDGVSKAWWPSGQLKSVKPWKNRVIDGTWTFWYENGQKELERIYKDGKPISEELWNEDGSVKE